jgi:hypothetical protein
VGVNRAEGVGGSEQGLWKMEGRVPDICVSLRCVCAVCPLGRLVAYAVSPPVSSQ